jgi:hypothetical protein
MSPSYRTNQLHSSAKLAGYGTHRRVSYEIQPTNEQECAKNVLGRYKNIRR